jgi:predicted dehydrogenase
MARGCVRILLFGTGQVWERLIKPALRALTERLGLELEIWAVEREPKGDGDPSDSLISKWFYFNRPQDVQEISNKLDKGSFQLAIIATWNETHIPLLLWLLGRVPRVLLEKPVADEVPPAELALSLIEAVEVKP